MVLVESPPPQVAAVLSEATPPAGGPERLFEDGPVSVVLTSGTMAARDARVTVEHALEGRAREAVNDALIVVSELVTNSVLHADLAPGDPIDLRLHAGGATLTICVVDEGPGFEPSAQRPVDFATAGGNGLPLVDMISIRWGVTRGPSGVWAELPA